MAEQIFYAVVVTFYCAVFVWLFICAVWRVVDEERQFGRARLLPSQKRQRIASSEWRMEVKDDEGRCEVGSGTKA